VSDYEQPALFEIDEPSACDPPLDEQPEHDAEVVDLFDPER